MLSRNSYRLKAIDLIRAEHTGSDWQQPQRTAAKPLKNKNKETKFEE